MTEESGASTLVGASDDARLEPAALPAGDYAIVEQLGHRVMVGRVAEVERFGANMLQVEALFAGKLLPPTLVAGASLYAFTPCSPEVALRRQPRRAYELPPALAAIAPTPALPAPDFGFLDEGDENGSGDAGPHGDGWLEDGSIQP